MSGRLVRAPRAQACLGVVLLGAVVAGCAPISVRVDQDPQADLSGYRGWGWLPEPAATGQQRLDDAALHQSIRRAIEAQLASRGYVAASEPQFRVGYHVSIEEQLRIREVSTSTPRRHPQGDRETVIRADTTTYVNRYERGTLVIDVVDASSGALVWRGAAERYLRREPTRAEMDESVRQAVEKILARFPGGPGAS